MEAKIKTKKSFYFYEDLGFKTSHEGMKIHFK
jgi:hypothetical protein